MSNKMWGGRFESAPAAIMEEINASIDFDKRLWRQDIRGSKAHAAMLGATGILTQDDVAAITRGLDQVAGEIESGTFTFSRALEDIHMNIESRLKEIVGEPADGFTPRARAMTRWPSTSGYGCATRSMSSTLSSPICNWRWPRRRRRMPGP